jgi:hypothetical protein
MERRSRDAADPRHVVSCAHGRNVAAVELKLAPEEWKAIDALAR